MRLSLYALAVLVLAQGAIFVGGLYLGEAHYFGQTTLWLILLVAILFAYTVFELFKCAITFGAGGTVHVMGRRLDAAEQPGLHRFVAALADKLGARKPDNLVVGLDPNFFATSAAMRLPTEQRATSGTTLFLSLPLSRLFTREELAAVIGHELGHFRGRDTAYSQRFAPIYAGLGSAIESVSDSDGGAVHWGALPARALLGFMYEVFATSERSIGRERELAADRAATEVAPVHALATSLVKCAMLSSLWDLIRENNVARLNGGLVTRNLSMAFANAVKYDIDHDSLSVSIAEMLEVEIAHPTDTHPAISERLEALDGAPDTITVADLKVPGESAIRMLEGHREIEEELTALEHRLMVETGLATIPDEDKMSEEELFDRIMLNVVYTVTAALVTADGHIDDEEIRVAEETCRRFLPNFEPVDFREYCYHPVDRPDTDEAIGVLADALSEEGKTLVMEMLEAVADADDVLAPEERDLLDRVRRAFAEAQ